MKCPDLETLADYLDGELTNGDHRLLESHLGTCEACRKALAREKVLAEVFKSQTRLQAPPQLRLQVMQALEAEPVRSGIPEWLWALGLGFVVIIVGLILGSIASPHLVSFKGWVNETLLSAPIWKSVTDLRGWSTSDWWALLPGNGSMVMLNLIIGGVILCWGLWQMIKALRR